MPRTRKKITEEDVRQALKRIIDQRVYELEVGGDKGEYCPIGLAVELAKKFNIPYEDVARLIAFSEMRILEASRVLAGMAELFFASEWEDEAAEVIGEAVEKLKEAYGELRKPGRVKKRALKSLVGAVLWSLDAIIEEDED